MLRTYDMTQMKELWRRRLGLLRDDCGCVVTRHDGAALDALIADHIRVWYAQLLGEADPSLLPARDMADDVTDVRRVSDNCLELDFPLRGVRPLLVRISDWRSPCGRFYTADSPEAALQLTQRLRATPARPLAVVCGRRILLHGLADGAASPEALRKRLRQLYMVAWPEEDDTFVLHPSLLTTIPAEI